MNDAATWVPVALGFALIIYSLFTNYELGLVRRIPMSTHLRLDVASGVLLAVSPWLFGFASIIWLPHVILGLAEIGAGPFTQTAPFGDRLGGPAAAAGPRRGEARRP